LKTKITELNFSDADKKEVRRIQATALQTKRKDLIRDVLGGPLCCCCSSIPTKKVEYDLDGLIRIETYCEKCYNDIYLNQIDLTNETIAERYGCTIVPPDTAFGRGKKGYPEDGLKK